MPSSAPEPRSSAELATEVEELRERLDELARERADEKAENAKLKARILALQNSLDDAHYHLNIRPTTLQRVRNLIRRLPSIVRTLPTRLLAVPRRILGGIK
ncbi:hypothetical protein [Pseudoclavibacter helvolus]|uniref:hypothetical protein n=1 Tax=Pseudoclavibacter helvolus TaxID=255205 RepID=UPI003C71B792